MRKRDKVSLTLPSLLLRLMLAATFIWAGLGKLRATETVEPEAAAVLANMGIIKPSVPPSADPNAPATRLPSGSAPDESKPTDEKPKDVAPAGPSTRDDRPFGGTLVLASFMQDAAPTTPPTTPGASNPPASSTSTPPPNVYTAKDFPAGATTLRVNSLAYLMYRSSHPAPAADGSPTKATWPKQFGEGRVPLYLAWAVAIGEIACGGLVLIGLTTRLSALGLASIMLGAIWLTQIGPAFATGQTVLGFLPAYETFNNKQWTPLMWQFSLLIASLALFFAGPGLLAIDNAIFSRPKRNDDHDGE